MFIVVGATGQIGVELVQQLQAKSANFIAYDSHSLDIANADSVKTKLQAVLQTNKNEQEFILINCAALTNVDLCQQDSAKAWEVNFDGVKNLVDFCNDFGIEFMHLSTDYVFNGQKNTPYDIFDKTNPIQVYGETKTAAELYIQSTMPQAVIVRTSLIFSGEQQSSDFITRIKDKLLLQKPFAMVDDQIGSATYAPHLVSSLLEIATRITEIKGIVHIVNEEYASRYDYAMFIAELLQADRSLISRAKMSDFDLIAARPIFSVLATTSMIDLGLFTLPNWKQAFTEALNR